LRRFDQTKGTVLFRVSLTLAADLRHTLLHEAGKLWSGVVERRSRLVISAIRPAHEALCESVPARAQD